jgi:hypothetical protein
MVPRSEFGEHFRHGPVAFLIDDSSEEGECLDEARTLPTQAPEMLSPLFPKVVMKLSYS